MTAKKTKEKADIFDKTNENFKKIFTDKGMNLDELGEFIYNALELVPEEEKLSFLEYLFVTEIFATTTNMYEALGVLESAKDTYLRQLKCPNELMDDDIELSDDIE